MEGKEGKTVQSLPWLVVAFSFCVNFHYTWFIFRVEKYRPKSLEDLISHKEIISTSEHTTSHSVYLASVDDADSA